MGSQAISTTFIGNVTNEVEVRDVNGKPVATFGLAVTDSHFDRESSKWVDEETLFFKVSTWGSWAQTVASSVSKGDRVSVHGHLKVERWTDKATGAKREALVISADDVALSLRFKPASRTGGTPTRANVVHSSPSPEGDDQGNWGDEPNYGGW